jgi:hypothetical protein
VGGRPSEAALWDTAPCRRPERPFRATRRVVRHLADQPFCQADRVNGDGMPTAGQLLQHGILEVASPLRRHMRWRLPAQRVHTVQIKQPLSDRDYRSLAAWLADHPAITLRAWANVPDLEFLRFFPKLLRFSADTFYQSPESFDGLRHLRPDLHSLTLGSTNKRLSLGPLKHFTGLRRLHLEKQTKDVDVLSHLTSIRSLTLREITLPGLALLLPLTGLRALDLKLGGTHDLSLLPRLGQLEYLELWMVQGVDDLGPLSEVHSLRYLHLEALKQVTALPANLSGLSRLDTVWIETMKSLTDFTPLLTASALRRVALVNMAHLEPAQVGVLANHPQLRCLIAGLGSDRKNRAVRELVPLPEGDDEWDPEPRRTLLAGE